MLLIGMWSVTQINVIGFLGISELIIFVIAPVVYIRYRLMFKRDGLGTLFCLIFLTMISCWVSGWWNSSGLIETVKGFASIYGVFAGVTVLYPLLRKRPDALGLFLLGVAISSVISIFIFQPGSAHAGADFGKTGMSRADLQQSVTGYALFWFSQVNTWANLPVQMAYLSVPMMYSICAPIITAVFALVSTSSGRSAFLVTAFSAVLLMIGGKSVKSLSQIRRRFLGIFIMLSAAGLVFATSYKYLARTGALGEASRAKYERQLARRGKGGDTFWGMLVSGRVEFFIGAVACLKHPILGCGPKAMDKEGIVGEYYSKYGTAEEFNSYVKTKEWNKQFGIYYTKIPGHSHIVTYWLWFGIVGGILWAYILFLCIKTLKNYMSAIPQWFGYFALILPTTIWAIFFSPFGDRLAKSVLICCCFIAKNVFERKIELPQSMVREIMRHWR